MRFVMSSSSKHVAIFFTFCFLALNHFHHFGSNAQLIPQDEVKILQTISDKVENLNWKVTQRSCNKGDRGFDNRKISRDGDQIIRNVTCHCSFNNGTVCHVISIALKGINISGPLPDEFGNLTRLKILDLTRNYFNGSIPKSLGRLSSVEVLSLLGNRFTGSIPSEISDMTSLQELNLEDNQLEGHLPPSLGKMSNLQKLLLSANNFTGTIPEAYGKLKNLTQFRIDGSTLSGKIPSFIGNWTKLDRLDLQGTSLEGPIPSVISELIYLTELRISDLKGPTMTFPNLTNLNLLQRLELRNCLITGQIPSYIGQKQSLKTLDLSSNMLTGPIPDSFQDLEKINYLFLTNNSLSGRIPNWIQTFKQRIDLSLNNFSESFSNVCQVLDVNLASSLSPSANTSSSCLKKGQPCSGKPRFHSLFINCGGPEIEFDGNEYEADPNLRGISNYVVSNDGKWAYSSTGVYLGRDKADYVANNQFNLKINGSDYYQTARLAPLYLHYYGLCMLNGNYKVKLHFAEITFSDDNAFTSLGRRVFDVSIQGFKYLKDFNIVEEAGGVGKGITKEFNVNVTHNTLEIHFSWAGKGTNAIPERGIYGPLISAITVTPNFKVPSQGLSTGAIAGIGVGICVFIILILLALWKMGFLCGKEETDQELLGLKTGYFSLRQIKAATDNFDPANKIGEGGFGPVYKGVLSDGAVIAVKQLSSKSKQGNREFINEIGMISALQHPNLVKLYGCCIEGNQLLLVYEYMENNSLARALFGKEHERMQLDWPRRMKICVGIAKGLAYLHEESRLKIVHRDIKATNVLLDKHLHAKISDFGLAKLDEEENTHISTRIAGTIGYMAPEYAMRGYLTDKADVYSFGIVALEIVSGKSNTNYRPKEEFVYLLDWAYVLQEQGNLLDLVDPSLGSKYSSEEAMRMLQLALLCTNPSPTLRPPMSSVVSMLQGKTPIQAPPIIKGSDNAQDARFKALEFLSQDSQTHVSSDFSQDSIEQRSKSMGGPWVDSTISIPSRTDHSSDKLITSSNDECFEVGAGNSPNSNSFVKDMNKN
ncbi:probable LRR receptor-like serine/threonine-protein kinase At1g53430 isoform X1 [Vigna unguiculata]|uniref:non-specific serine/threonine protein kinase n=1 Tax=Vigna unguiculata TaxID=3917 RepID=A0A4D6N8R6_VIGUN|nr:probable LRR receptor-like serine/threonine-protein kinase At1g53430 isoform X1 [Vigna unguiculata]QCE10156.1 brassinosteroid insensitive 1-associated receptor kinase 1 [Vigna unguiculata]